MNTTEFDRAAEYIVQADGLLITAGAGMGVDSGLPDFRGKNGFWHAYPVLGQERISFENIAAPQYFHTDPSLAWGFYGHRLALYRRTIPHTGFELLKSISARLPLGAFVFTSNVDGQFQKAGFSEKQIIECHGSVHWLQCISPACNGNIWRADSFRPQIDESRCRLINSPPTCPNCGGVARPNILMFNDWDWIDDMMSIQRERQRKWQRDIERLVTIELGAGSAIPTVRRFGESMNGPLIRINPTDEQIATNQAGVAIRLGALDGLNGIAGALIERGFLSETSKPRNSDDSCKSTRFPIERNRNTDAESSIQLIAKKLAQSDRVLFITGAGISAESGLPTYRGVGGIYNDTVTEEGVSIETALSARGFATRPEITWKYLAQIEKACRGAQPNAAHLAIAELERHIPYVLILTQNVDGLHHKAGSSQVVEIHGSLRNLFCTRCNFKKSVDSWESMSLPPMCPACGGVLRTNVVLFDENLPTSAVDRLHVELELGFDMVITIGTSSTFHYIAQPVMQAAQAGISTVEINPIKTKLSMYVDFHLAMGAVQAMLSIMGKM
jgi:NAD-dependent SIR2 family protein deacetylase